MLKSVKMDSIVFSSNSIWPAFCIRPSSDLNWSIGDTDIRSTGNTHLPTCSFPNTYGLLTYMEEAEKGCRHVVLPTVNYCKEKFCSLSCRNHSCSWCWEQHILPCSHEGSKSKFSCTLYPHGSKWTSPLCCCQSLKLKSCPPGLTKSLQLCDHCVHASVASFCFALFIRGNDGLNALLELRAWCMWGVW